MYVDFKESVIMLMQHPMLHKPITSLTAGELEKAYDLLRNLINLSVDEEYTLLDNIQMARLEYNLAELAERLDKDYDKCVMPHYRSALRYLTIGGFDLSMDKWAELVSLRTIE